MIEKNESKQEKEKTGIRKKVWEEGSKIDYLANSASTMECTGLLHRPAENEAESEAYGEVYHFLAPEEKE
ncbi:MAG: hypothetical protein SO160_08885 [Lachnospiraceae bacterium]|nr:hypothetical protein [Lachnospiraceae bacterium]